MYEMQPGCVSAAPGAAATVQGRAAAQHQRAPGTALSGLIRKSVTACGVQAGSRSVCVADRAMVRTMAALLPLAAAQLVSSLLQLDPQRQQMWSKVSLNKLVRESRLRLAMNSSAPGRRRLPAPSSSPSSLLHCFYPSSRVQILL